MARISMAQAKALGLTTAKGPARAKGMKVESGSAAMFKAACKANGLPEPSPEVKWHPTRKYLADWCWSLLVTERPTILEIQGGIYGRGKPCPVCKRRAPGAHSSIERMLSDIERRNELAIHGWTLVECLPEDVGSGKVFSMLRKVLS